MSKKYIAVTCSGEGTHDVMIAYAVYHGKTGVCPPMAKTKMFK